MASSAPTVYTTQDGRICSTCGKPAAACICKKKPAGAGAGDGVVRVALDRKGRGGKIVSVISGLPLNEEALRALAADLKRRCGSGGTVKDGIIEIQGDHRDTLISALKANGYPAKKAGG